MKNCHMNYFQQQRQKIIIKNAFAKNVSTDRELSKHQLTKLIESGRFLGKS